MFFHWEHTAFKERSIPFYFDLRLRQQVKIPLALHRVHL